MADFIEDITSFPHQIASGGSLTAEVRYRCLSPGRVIEAVLVGDGFIMSADPPRHAAAPGAGAHHVDFRLTLTRTSAAPGSDCHVEFTMNSPSAPGLQIYTVD